MKKKNIFSSSNGLLNQITITTFIITFLIFAFLTTIQMNILKDYISYKEVSKTVIVEVIMFWICISISITMATRFLIKRNYDKPMLKLSEATRKVASGDFSVYLAPRHTSDKHDYIDKTFLDFNKMVEELGSIQTLKTDFISNVSHEIKTPIAIMQNYAEMLKADWVSDGKRIVYAETIELACKRLASLISNILKLNKLENQKITLEVASYDVCEQLVNCSIQFQELWEEKELNFEADIEDVGIINADESLMEVVWNNLLSNAIKFSDNGGKISLKQTSTEDLITVSVSDTGCGISEETASHIFDKFYQGDTSHSKQGNGLGLALVARILELSNCTISVESKEKEGTTFTVNIPINYSEDHYENK